MPEFTRQLTDYNECYFGGDYISYKLSDDQTTITIDLGDYYSRKGYSWERALDKMYGLDNAYAYEDMGLGLTIARHILVLLSGTPIPVNNGNVGILTNYYPTFSAVDGIINDCYRDGSISNEVIVKNLKNKYPQLSQINFVVLDENENENEKEAWQNDDIRSLKDYFQERGLQIN